jgi:hypothetical protein
MNKAVKILRRAIIEFQDLSWHQIQGQSNTSDMSQKAVFVAYEKAYSEAINVFYELLNEIDADWDGKRVLKEMQDET